MLDTIVFIAQYAAVALLAMTASAIAAFALIIIFAALAGCMVRLIDKKCK